MTTTTCPLCVHPLDQPPADTNRGGSRYTCSNCGLFEVTGTFQAVLRASQETPARMALLSHAIRRMQRDGSVPQLTSHLADALWKADRLPRATDQFDNLIMHLGTVLTEPGAQIDLDPSELRAILGSITADGAAWVLRTCEQQGLVEGHVVQTVSGPTQVIGATLSASGWARFQELQTHASGSRRAFMAMRFGDAELDRMFVDHFKPACKRAGFDLMRLDEEPSAGLIDDRLRLEIRRSRFLLADLSHTNAGAYWEAGYAEGLGRPVIYTCRRDIFENAATKPHFDTNHHLTILWDPSGAQATGDALTTTIRVTLPAEAKLED